eukprot:TRINITY_DN11676_c3_g2_i1.p1 TRINITY_DN11676_c3_g2~~TRINITY_DN11676_c3_g2_i1.p1  ORF type:complete len:244 (+),score=75.13 TRINITY_DN11676_c3_g2_i1:396-1127(+)
MGNCSSEAQPQGGYDSRGNVNQFRKHVARTLGKAPELVAKPSDMTAGMFCDSKVPGVEDCAEVYLRDFHWFCTAHQAQQDFSQLQKAWYRNPYMKKDGLMHATVNDVCSAVDAAERRPGGSAACCDYTSQCHSAAWRQRLQEFMRGHGVSLSFDFVPKNAIEDEVHREMGLYKEGYSFSFHLINSSQASDDSSLGLTDARTSSSRSMSTRRSSDSHSAASKKGRRQATRKVGPKPPKHTAESP